MPLVTSWKPNEAIWSRRIGAGGKSIGRRRCRCRCRCRTSRPPADGHRKSIGPFSLCAAPTPGPLLLLLFLFSFRSFLSLSLLWFCLFCLLPMRNEGNDCVAIITVSSLVDWFAVRHGAAFVDSNSLPKKWMRLKCTEMVPTWSRHKKTYGYRKMVRAHKSRSYHGVSVLWFADWFHFDWHST